MLLKPPTCKRFLNITTSMDIKISKESISNTITTSTYTITYPPIYHSTLNVH